MHSYNLQNYFENHSVLYGYTMFLILIVCIVAFDLLQCAAVAYRRATGSAATVTPLTTSRRVVSSATSTGVWSRR